LKDVDIPNPQQQLVVPIVMDQARQQNPLLAIVEHKWMNHKFNAYSLPNDRAIENYHEKQMGDHTCQLHILKKMVFYDW
jgi:hypothetical protein